MTAVASPGALPPSLLPRASRMPPSSADTAPPPHAAATSPPSPDKTASMGASAVDDDDLLALGAFSLENPRDKELLCLSSFLKGVLPAAAAGGSAAHPPALNAGLTLSNAASAVATGGWNGWRPQGGDGSAAPYGSPMSFASTASMQPGSLPPGSPFQSHHHAFPYPSPAQAYSPLQAPIGSPLGVRGSWAAAAPGYRAPTCSRERVPTLAAFAGAGTPGDGEGVDGGWKSRLRSGTRRAAQEQQQQPRRDQQQQQHARPDRDEDSMME